MKRSNSILVLSVIFIACITLVFLIFSHGDYSSKEVVISPLLMIPSVDQQHQAHDHATAMASAQNSSSGSNPLPPEGLELKPIAPSRLRDTLAWITEQGEGGSASDKCSAAFGLPFVQSWRAGVRQDLCEPTAGADSSRIIFYPVKMPTLTEASGRRENLAMEAFDLVLVSSQDYTSSFAKGSITASCKISPDASSVWDHAEKRGGQAALRKALLDSQSQACVPGDNVVDHPVLLLHRYDTTNAYHNLEDVLGVFMSLAMINSEDVKAKGIQVSRSRSDQIQLDLCHSIKMIQLW